MSVIPAIKPTREVLMGFLLILFLAPGMAFSQTFHTSPECWQQPRMFHAGPPPAEFANRVHIIQTGSDLDPAGTAVLSPNNAYRFWVREVALENLESGAGVVIDVEKAQRSTLLFQGAAQSPAPRWLNEKLLYLRVMWGRIVYSDLIFDVEKSELIFHETVQDGSIAWQQFQQACQGRCPCGTEPETAQKPLPQSLPGPDEIIGLLELPTVFGIGATGGVIQAHDPVPVAVYSAPSVDAVVLARLNKPQQWAFREIAYEAGAAEVYEQLNGWYRVRIIEGNRYGWVVAGAERFHSLADLLPDRLAFLNPNWNAELWNLSADFDSPAQVKLISAGTEGDSFEYPVEILQVRNTEQGLWLNVRLLSSNGCDGGTVQIVDTGWVPAYSARGALNVWYWSRGC